VGELFSGIVTDRGEVRAVSGEGERRFVIATGYDPATFAIGASIACNGCCLTVVDKPLGGFAVDVSAETLSKTTLGDWVVGSPVNLEQALRLGDSLDGHLVLGHVDGLAAVTGRRQDGSSLRLSFRVAGDLGRFIAPKGSVALDGVSLTVNEVEDTAEGDTLFGVNIIPHTAAVTTLGRLEAGGRVNLEIDPLARYVARLSEESVTRLSQR